LIFQEGNRILGNKLLHYLEHKFACLPKSLFSLGEKHFPKPLTVYDSQQVAREYSYAYSFSFSAKAARGARAKEFHFKKEKLYLNDASSLCYSVLN